MTFFGRIITPIQLSLFLLSIGAGTTITFSSSSWLLAWIGLEINTISIIPLIVWSSAPRASEATTKYFLIQACAATLVLFAAILNLVFVSEWGLHIPLHNATTTILIIALSLKLGLAPFHFWIPEVLQGLDLPTGIILSTLQKFAPFVIMHEIMETANFINSIYILLFSIAIISIFVGGLGGLNQVHIRKLLAYSSIAHLGWIILVITLNHGCALIAIAIYVITTCAIFILIIWIQAKTVKSAAAGWTKTPIIAFLLALVLFSLAGLPPFLGFAPKWFILNQSVTHNIIILVIAAIVANLITLFFYIRLLYHVLITLPPAAILSSIFTRFNPKKTSIYLPGLISFIVFGITLVALIISCSG